MERTKSGPDGSFTKISREAKIEGVLNCDGMIIIDGTVIGKIDSKDCITISQSGNVESTIKAKDAVIEGSFSGDMIATGIVKIGPTGRFSGNLIQKKGASLIVEKGGLLKGKTFAPSCHID
jgi:cytoskeletal protein CcmA (bactofilin family)